MKITLSKEEALKYLSPAIERSIIVSHNMQVESIKWTAYSDEIIIELEPRDEKSHVAGQKKLDEWQAGHANQLGRRPPPTPSTPPLINDGPNAADIEDAI